MGKTSTGLIAVTILVWWRSAILQLIIFYFWTRVMDGMRFCSQSNNVIKAFTILITTTFKIHGYFTIEGRISGGYDCGDGHSK